MAAESLSAISIPVLANDYDVDGDGLQTVSTTNPAHGTATISGDQVLYIQTRGFDGLDTFTYTIADGQGGEDTATVTILLNMERQYFPFVNR